MTFVLVALEGSIKSATGMDKVYLDSNILIEGPHRPEHARLAKLSQERKITLYFSWKSELEMHGKTLPLRRKRDAVLPYGLGYATFKKLNEDYEKAASTGEQEWQLWNHARLMRAQSTFGTNVSIAGLDYSTALQLDKPKREFDLLEELIIKYKIGADDAFNLMHAHSAGMDYFLTWDELLVKRAKNVEWLKYVVCKPETFCPISVPTSV
jgi:predicted nucleic acid-binding protein